MNVRVGLLVLATLVLVASSCRPIPEDYPEGDAGQEQADASACDDECEGDTPVCDESAGECVECLDAEEDCEDDEFCSDDGECVECLEEKDCDEGVCSEDGECVECAEDDDCTEADASACSEDNKCTACEESDQCAHLDDTPACDADASECVECTVDDESACDGNSCDPESNTCTDTETDSLDTCETCIADSECSGEAGCVPLEFDGEEFEDGFCLPVQVDDGCPSPYGVIIDDRTSLSGVEGEEYCGINEDRTTCEAVLDHLGEKDCEEDGINDSGKCGLEGEPDGRCIDAPDLSVDFVCSYPCDEDAECVEGCSNTSCEPLEDE